MMVAPIFNTGRKSLRNGRGEANHISIKCLLQPQVVHRGIIVFACILLLAWFQKSEAQPKEMQSFSNIDAVEFHMGLQKYGNAVLIDVRTKREHKTERIPNSVLADKKKVLMSMMDTLDREQPLYVYCDEGSRSFTACIILADNGFTHIYNLEKGLIEWKKQGFVLEE